MSDSSPCPCGSSLTYEECCGVFHAETRFPETAEQLMRARYTAYYMHLVDFLTNTQHPSLEAVEIDESLRFQSLRILSSSQGGPGDKQGKVEFVATGVSGSNLVEHREKSRFRRFEGKWIYFDHKG